MLPLQDVNPTTRTPIVTIALILACIGAWVFWQQEPSRDAVEDLAFNLENAAIPCEVVEGRPLTQQEIVATFDGRFGSLGEECNIGSAESPAGVPDKNVYVAGLASMFFHGGLLHIGGNMLYLWIFGNNIEDHLGHVRYLLFYLLGGVAATVTHVALAPDSTVPVIGASGAVAAVMGAYLVWFPKAPVRTVVFFGLPWIVTIAAQWLLGFWFISQFFTSPNSGVAWAAHVGGFVFGVLAGLVIRRVEPVQRVTMRPPYRGEPWDSTGGVGSYRESRPVRRR